MKRRTIQPYGRWVLVEMDPIEETTAGGIVIADTEECPERFNSFGTVLAAGKGGRVLRDTSLKKERDYIQRTGDRYRFVPNEFQPGMRVYSGPFNGIKLPREYSGNREWRLMDAGRDIYLVEDAVPTRRRSRAAGVP